MSDLQESIKDFNPWWKGEFQPELRDREIYGKIKKYLKMPQIIAFVGLRRVGKTSLMKTIVKEYLDSGFEQKRIFYFSFDFVRNDDIRELIKTYENIINLNIKEGNYIILLDEIQKIKGWENQLKVLYDVFGKNVKFIISGSESLFIRKNSKESLAGRIFEFKIESLNFREFLLFRSIRYDNSNLYSEELQKLFWEFCLTMGFPELVNVNDKSIIKKYIKDGIIDKVLYKDIQQILGPRDIGALESLLNILMEDPGQMIDLNELAAELKISRQTVSVYISYLELAFLLRKVYNYSGSRRKVERKLKKYYPTIISPNLLMRDDDFSRSKVFEWLIVTQLNAEFFWRDSFKNEVDIIMEDKTPIEVKYGKIDISGLKAFMKKFKQKKGIVITSKEKRKYENDGLEINLIPAYEYFMKSP
ncbi:MAG: ATP-binding protein [Candidatus Micrarchaeota archaeon]